MRSQLGQRHRYEHTIRVARCADLLAQRHHIDARKARLAGMLHDLARLYSPKRLLDECAARHMTIDAFERANPVVLHARLGAALAHEMFAIDDCEVLDAIAKHTTATPQMSPLDCVLYLADGLEPGRDFPQRAELWALAQRDLRAAMAATLKSSLANLHERGVPIAPQTEAAAVAFATPSNQEGERTS